MSKARENRKKSRVKLKEPLRVIMGSIGSDVRYDLQTRDVSFTGFFLDFQAPGRFPFTPASIMEVWLELEDGNTIFFNGKMARVVYPTDNMAKDTGPGIAIRIVQIDPKFETNLVKFVENHVEHGQDGSNEEQNDKINASAS